MREEVPLKSIQAGKKATPSKKVVGQEEKQGTPAKSVDRLIQV